MRLTIRTKIAGLCFLLIAGTILVLSHFSSLLLARANAEWAQHLTEVTSKLLAEKLRSRLETLGADAQRWAVSTEHSSDTVADELAAEGIQALWVFRSTPDHGFLVKSRWLSRDLNDLDSVRDLETALVQEVSQLPGSSERFRASLTGGNLVLVGPVAAQNEAFAVLVPDTGLLGNLPAEDGVVSHFLISGSGRVFSPNADAGPERESAIREYLDMRAEKASLSLAGEDHDSRWWANFEAIGYGTLTVGAVSSSRGALLLTESQTQKWRYLIGAVLALGLVIAVLYSLTITQRLRRLHSVVQRITRGDYQARTHLHEGTRDELGDLSQAVNAMAQGLEERRKVTDVFRKLVDKKIADHLMSGELKLGGELREAIILFCDLRNFTRLTESLPPESVVTTLNDFFSHMVPILVAHGAVIDKYLGDGLLAFWGFPTATKQDATHAVFSCLAMREELSVMNGLRQARGQLPLQFGMGLSAGRVITGNIGAEERMEYTLIGDAVNVASRLESLTKVLRTDLLVSRSVCEKASSKFRFEACPGIKVKGKLEPVEAYKLMGAVIGVDSAA